MTNQYRRGANEERKLVNKLATDPGLIFVGRFASSKVKGKLKIDVAKLTNARLDLYQVKKGTYSKKEKRELESIRVPEKVSVNVHWVHIP